VGGEAEVALQTSTDGHSVQLQFGNKVCWKLKMGGVSTA
jgi:hypothetical protein